MDRKISLSWFLSLSFLGIALLPVVGYAFLSLSFFGKGLDSIISANLAQAVQLYAADIPAAGRRGLQNVNGLEIAPRWEDMPAEVRDNLTPPLREGALYKYDLGSWPDPPQQLNFVMRVRADGQDYYVRQGVRQEDASPLVGRQMAETVRILLGVSAVTVAALFLFTRLLIRKVSRPAKALADWAAELDEQRLKETPPDFCYPELNKLAALIRKSLVAEHRSLERERLFLQYSSHELRTPISLVLAATELLRKIMSRRGTYSPGQCCAERIPAYLARHHSHQPARRRGRSGQLHGQRKRSRGRHRFRAWTGIDAAADGPARLALHKPGFSRPERGDCAPVGNGGFALLTHGSRCGGFFQQIDRSYENYLDFEIHFQL